MKQKKFKIAGTTLFVYRLKTTAHTRSTDPTTTSSVTIAADIFKK